MPNFKPKNNKKIRLNKTNESLDCKHDKFLQEFEKDETTIIPQLIKQRQNLSNKFKSELNNFDRKLQIKDEIIQIDAKIQELKKNKKQYLLDNSEYIFDYFENKKKIAEGNGQIKTLDKFFNINDKDKDENINLDKTITNIQKYFSNVDINYLDINNFINPTDICRFCNEGELIPVEHEGIMICNKCHKHTRFLVENDKPTYKEPS